MTATALLALTGDVLISVKARNTWNLKHLVRIKQMINGTRAPDMDYDFNGDGVIDAADQDILTNIILNS